MRDQVEEMAILAFAPEVSNAVCPVVGFTWLYTPPAGWSWHRVLTEYPPATVA